MDKHIIYRNALAASKLARKCSDKARDSKYGSPEYRDNCKMALDYYQRAEELFRMSAR